MKKRHPVLLQRGFIMKSPPLVEFGHKLTRLITDGELSMVCWSPPRYGKTTASAHIRRQMVFSGQMAVYWATAQEPRPPEQRSRYDEVNDLWYDMLRRKESENDPIVRTPYVTLVNRIRMETDLLDTPDVLIVVDEGQHLPPRVLGALKKLAEDLIECDLCPFILLFAQANILTHAERLRKGLRLDLTDRFLLRMHRFRGLQIKEFTEVLRYYDTTCWPEGSQISYTAHFAPRLWEQGLRLESHASAFVYHFQRLARQMGADESDIGMKYLVQSVRSVLNSLSRDEKPVADAIKDGVYFSGYREAALVVGNYEMAVRDAGKKG